MNERIKELAEQARASVPAGLVVSEWIEGYNQKLAELIIQECCNMVSKRPYVDDGVSIYLHPSTIIKRHFGIKE